MRTISPEFQRRPMVRLFALLIGIALLGVGGIRVLPADAAGACGARVLFLIDRSSSIGVDQFSGGAAASEQNVAHMRAGITEFGTALAGPDSAMDVFAFATTATRIQRPGTGNAWVPMTDQQTATFYAATVANLAFKRGATPSVQDAYPGAPLRWFDGTELWHEAQPDRFPASNEGLTNWDDALRLATLVGSWHAFNDGAPTHVVFLTDGSPTTNTAEREAAERAGYRFPAGAHDPDPDDLAPAIVQADAIRASGIKIVPVGIGQVNRDNLQSLAGAGNPIFYASTFSGVAEQLKAAAADVCETVQPDAKVNVATYVKDAAGRFSPVAVQGLRWRTDATWQSPFATPASGWTTPIVRNQPFTFDLAAPAAPPGLVPTNGPRSSAYDCFVGNPDGSSATPITLNALSEPQMTALRNATPVQPGQDVYCRFFYEGAPKTGSIAVSETITIADLNAGTEATFEKAAGWTFEVLGTGLEFTGTTTAGTALTTPFTATGVTDVTIARIPAAGFAKASTPTCRIDGAAVPATGFTETVDSITLKAVPPGANVDCVFFDEASKGVEIVKGEAAGRTTARPGEQVTYTFEVTNTGSLALRDVVVDDPTLGGEVGTIATLAAGATATVPNRLHTIPADAAATYRNTATATGQAVSGSTDYGAVSATAEYVITITVTPGLTLDKRAVAANSDTEITTVAVGEAFRYRFEVTNTGDVRLDDVVITDEELGLTGNRSIAIGAIEPGQSKVAYAPYTVAATDARDVIDNVARACAGSTCAEDDASVAIDRTTAWTVVKSVDRTVVRDGDTVTWTIKVTNTGTKAIKGLRITDSQFPDAFPDPVDIPVGQSVSKTVSKKMTAGDFDERGRFANTACAKVDTTSECSPTVVVHLARVKLTKVANPTTVRPGDKVTYTFTVENIGGAELTDVVVTDPTLAQIGGAAVRLDLAAPLAPGATSTPISVEVTLPTTLTGDSLTNTAAVVGVPVDPETGKPVPDRSVTATATATVAVVRPAFSVHKTADTTVAKVGDVVEYAVTVTNTGNVELTDLVVVDEMLALDETVESLAPGESTTLTRKWVVPSAAAGAVTNVVTVCVEAYEICREAEVTIDVLLIGIVKSTDVDHATPGDRVTYSFTVTNRSAVTLEHLEVTDDQLGLVGVIEELAPGASTTLTKEYAVPADAAAAIVNVATVCVEMPDGTPAPLPTVADPPPATKDAGEAKEDRDEVSTVPEPCAPACPTDEVPVTPPPLPPLATTTTTASTTTTAASTTTTAASTTTTAASTTTTAASTTTTAASTTTAGSITTTAVAQALALTATDAVAARRVLCATDDHTLPIGRPAITVEKDADRDQALAGETITYRYTVRNAGDTPLTEVTLVDDMLGAIALDRADLAPGETAVGSATYVVQPGDQGTIVNIAVATGTTPDGTVVSGEAREQVAVVQVAPAQVDPPPPSGGSTAPRGSLPHTGSGTSGLVTVGLVLLGLGAIAVAAGKLRLPALAPVGAHRRRR